MQFDDLILPSRMKPYNCKSFEGRAFLPRDLTLVSRSATTGSVAPMIEAVGQTLEGIGVQELTVGDFYYLVAWQKFNTFPKSPPFASWECDGVMYLTDKGDMEHEGRRFFSSDSLRKAAMDSDSAKAAGIEPEFDLDEEEVEQVVCGHHNNVALALSNLTVLRLPDIDLDERLDYPRVSTLVEYIDYRAKPEYAHIASAAQWIKAGRTMSEKIEFLLDQPDTELFDLCSIVNQDVVHGVSNILNVGCSVCGTKAMHTIDLSAQSFFR